MPVTRSNSRQLHAGGPLLATPSPRRPIQRKPRPTDNDDDSDVIVLSSGDEEVRKIKQRPIRPRPKTKIKNTPSVDDIVEISSDDDQASDPTVSSLQKKLYKLEKENNKLKREKSTAETRLLHSCKELAELKASSRTVGKSKLVLEASNLEDLVNCEICTQRMWLPFFLTDCGHVFCQDCLQSWFSRTLTTHMTAYPNFNPNVALPHVPLYIRAQLENDHPDPALAPIVEQYRAQLGPPYTCPTCRKAVRNKPMEDYKLKALIRTLAEAAGETSPRKPVYGPGTSNGRAKGKTVMANNGPWDGFFPARAY